MKELTNGCLKCPKPKCQEACPLGTSIPEIVKLVENDQIDDALDLLYSKNPIPIITGLFCNGYCFQNCGLNKVGRPFIYQNLEKALGHLPHVSKVQDHALKGIKVAIIGAGPVGLALALLLKRSNATVVVFEKEADNLATVKMVFPNTKVSEEEVKSIDDFLLGEKLDIRYNSEIGKDILLDDLRKEYDYVVLAAGHCVSKSVVIDGDGNYYYAYDFLKCLKTPGYLDKFGDSFLLYGLGNVSIDLAVYLKKQGKDVKLVYHKPREKSRLSPHDIQKIDIYNLDVTFDSRIVKIDHNNVTLEHNGENFVIENRTTILAIGQKSDLVFLNESEIKEDDLIYDDNCESKVKNFYMAGDFSSTRWDISTGIETAWKIYRSILSKEQK